MTTRFIDHLLTGTHAARPAANAVPQGTLYVCTDHNLIYQSDGSAVWSTWADLAAGAAVASVTSAEHLSVDSRVTSINTGLSAISSRSVGDVSTHGLQSVINALSNRISAAGGGGGSVTSTELSVETAARVAGDNALSAAVNVVSNALSLLSDRATSISAQLTSVDLHASTASGAATSADAHASIASAAATSADAHASVASAAATSVNARVTSVNTALSAFSARSIGDVSTHGLQSILNALSNRLSVETSIRGASISVLSLAVTSVDSRLASVSALLATSVQTASAAATSADTHANAASAAATSVDARLVSVSALLATSIQTASAAATSADAHASVASIAATSVNSRVNSVNTFISGISARSVGNVSTHGFQSVVDALSNRISAVVGGTASVTSAEHASVDSRVTSVNTRLDVVSVLSVGGISTEGLQSALNALSNRISAVVGGTASVTSAEHTSVDARITSINSYLSAISTASDITSVDGLQSVVNQLSVKIETNRAVISGHETIYLAHDTQLEQLESAISGVSGFATAGLQSVITAASLAVISVDSRVTSASAVFAAGLTSADNRITSASAVNTAAATSLDNRNTSILSLVNTGAVGQFKVVTGAQAIATATFTKISGLSLSIAGSGLYEIHGQVIWSQSGGGSASAIFGFGMSMTAQPTMAMFRMMGNAGALGALSGLQNLVQYGGNSAICGTPSIMYSAKPNPGASGSVAVTMFFDGVLQASTAQSQLKAVAQCSTAAFGIQIQAGSWIRAFKLN